MMKYILAEKKMMKRIFLTIITAVFIWSPCRAAPQRDVAAGMNALDATSPELVEAGAAENTTTVKSPVGSKTTNTTINLPRPEVAPDVVVAGAEALLRRVVPGSVEKFRFECIARDNGMDVFEIESVGDRIVLRGSDTVALASALNWYLRYYAHRETDFRVKTIELPNPLPPVDVKVRHVTSSRYRWFFNFCTYGYDLAWNSWPQTERLLDWLAMNGVNLALAPAGQEAVWRDLFVKYGFSDEEARAFLGGPAFMPWTLMLNIDHFGGPLPTGWIERSAGIQKLTVKRMNELGIMPVYPAFNGHVPADFAQRHPGSKLNPIRWYGPSPNTWMLDPENPKFAEMETFFVRRMTELYGSSHFYAIDTFIEMIPPSDAPEYLRSVSANIHRGLIDADPEAVWVLQGWMFMNPAREKFWQKPQRDAFLGAVPAGGLLVLDMSGGRKAQELNWFDGHAWLWTTVHDFGNQTGFFGKPFNLLNKLDALRNAPRRFGTGIIGEGRSSTPVVYAALMEATWREQVPEPSAWFMEYAGARYGKPLPAAREAWRLLGGSVFDRNLQDCAVVKSPDIIWAALLAGKEPGNRLSVAQRADLTKACDELLSCRAELSANPCYQYDVMSVVRDLMTDRGLDLVKQMYTAFAAGDREAFQSSLTRFREVMTDMDQLVGTQEDFLLGRWIASARACATNLEDADLYEWNARNLITLWGTRDRNIRDYARRHWSGLIADFYLPRWELFAGYLDGVMSKNAKFDPAVAKKTLVEFEDMWCRKKNGFPAEPTGDPVAVASMLREKYREAK